MTSLSHAGNSLIVVSLGDLLLADLVPDPDRPALYLWGLIAGLAPDLDVLTLWFDRDLYDSESTWAHRGIGHSLVPITVLIGLMIALAPPHWTAGQFFAAGSVMLVAHIAHVICDLLTESFRSGIPALFPLSARRFPYWGRIKWYNHFLVFLFTVYLLLLAILLSLRAGREALAILGAAVLTIELSFVICSNYRQEKAGWTAHQQRWLTPLGYRWVDGLLVPLLAPWRRRP